MLTITDSYQHFDIKSFIGGGGQGWGDQFVDFSYFSPTFKMEQNKI